jgi:hypothetical protein
MAGSFVTTADGHGGTLLAQAAQTGHQTPRLVIAASEVIDPLTPPEILIARCQFGVALRVLDFAVLEVSP